MKTPHHTLIAPSKGWSFIKLHELWIFRELFYFLAWRDVKVRYKQTILGIVWVILQPLVSMAIFTLFFGRLAQIPSDGVPYSLFALTGLVPWLFFTNGVNNASQSVVSEANLIKKVYFPRLIVPTATIAAAFCDFLFSFAFLFLVLPFYDIYPTTRFLFFPILTFFMIITALGISYWLSAFNVLFRDIKYTIPFLMQIWMFMTPIVYPSSLLPESWRFLFSLNPMVGIVEGFRWIILGNILQESFLSSHLVISFCVGALLFVTGALYFRKIETTFADVV